MAKNKMTIVQMNAVEELYGYNLTKQKVARFMLSYEVGTLAFTVLLYERWWITLIWMVLVGLYVYKSLLPKQVMANYKRRALTERNRFINMVTQGMATKNANIVAVLRRAKEKVKGEFADDLSILIATLVSEDNYEAKHQAFKNLSDKYKEDIYFVLFLEQIETVYHEDQYHIETFQTFKDSHNRLLMKQKTFIRKKKEVQTSMMSMLGLSFVMLAIMLMSNGIDKYISIYAHALGGTITSTIYLLVIGFIIHSFYKKYYDDEVTRF